MISMLSKLLRGGKHPNSGYKASILLLKLGKDNLNEKKMIVKSYINTDPKFQLKC